MSTLVSQTIMALWVLLLSVPGMAEPFSLPAGGEVVDVSDAFVSQVEEPGAALDPEDLKGSEENWVPNPKSWPYGNHVIWLRARFQNTGSVVTDDALALAYASPTVADFFVYDAAGRLVKSVANGTFSPWADRDLKLNLAGVRLQIPPGEVYTVLLREQSKSLVDSHFILRSYKAHSQLEWIYLAAYGLYFGLAIALFFHNLSLYFSVRDKVYLYYLTLVAAITFAMWFSSAYYAVVWYRLPSYLHNIPYATPSVVHIVAPLFIAEFLHIKLGTRWVGLGLALISVAGCLVALMQLSVPSLGNRFNIYLSLTGITVYAWACLHRIFQGEHYAWFLLAAVLSPMVAVVSYFVGTFILRISIHSDIIAVSFALEMLLMSTGLAHRVYIIRQRQHQLQAEQARVVHASKMRALSDMSSGVAHEVNNPLMIISGYADVIRRILNQDQVDVGRLREATLKIDHCVDRIAFIVNALRSFSQDEFEKVRDRFSLNTAVEKALAHSAARIKERGIQLNVALESSPLCVEGSESQSVEVILMLLDNAVEILNDAPEKKIAVTLQLVPAARGARARLSIQDSGPGVPPDLQSQLFQPFFTTRPVGEGAGLSLCRSHGIVESMQGDLSYERREGATYFIIELPLVA